MVKQPMLILNILLLIVSCHTGCNPLPAECRDFFLNQPAEQARAKFRTYPVEKQLDLYLCGMKVHPPRIGFAQDVAAGGEAVVPYLLERLKSDDDEYDQNNIIMVLEELSAKGHLRGRNDIVEQINQVVDAMKVEEFKEDARQRLQGIKKNV